MQFTRYIVERQGHRGLEWTPWAYPKNDRADAMKTLEWCRRNEKGTFRLIFETREIIEA